MDMKKVADFLSVGRTEAEIAKQFSLSEETVKKLLAKPSENYDLLTSKNKNGELIFRLATKKTPPILAPKIWKYTVAKDRDGREQPYMLVVIPDDTPGNQIKIYPLGDIHYGAKGHDSEAFKSYIKLIADKKHAFFVIIGDIIENALASSIGGAIYEQLMPPSQQIEEAREIFRPVAHKCLVAIPGNHENRTPKVANIDPLKLGICDPLAIPYFDEPTYLDIFWRGNIYTFFIQHGSSGAQTKGGKLNAASRPLSTNEHTMFTIMGHVHDPTSGKNVKRCIEFVRNEADEITNMSIVKRIEYVVICPATYRHLGTYGARAGYNPTAQNMEIACVLLEDGGYYLDRKELPK